MRRRLNRKFIISRSSERTARLLDWLRQRRVLVGIVVAIGLVAVPTAFTVFPTWATWPTPIRAAILVAWLAVAITGVVITDRANERMRHVLELERHASNARNVGRRSRVSSRAC